MNCSYHYITDMRRCQGKKQIFAPAENGLFLLSCEPALQGEGTKVNHSPTISVGPGGFIAILNANYRCI